MQVVRLALAYLITPRSEGDCMRSAASRRWLVRKRRSWRHSGRVAEGGPCGGPGKCFCQGHR